MSHPYDHYFGNFGDVLKASRRFHLPRADDPGRIGCRPLCAAYTNAELHSSMRTRLFRICSPSSWTHQFNHINTLTLNQILYISAPPPPPMRTLILPSIAAALVATGLYHLHNIYYSTYHIPLPHISSSNTIPSSIVTSVAVKLTNPHNHIPIHDTRHITVAVSKHLSDETILARFVKGFFGGHVFRLERGALSGIRKTITGFEGT